jgi:hypothetical protein
MTTVELKDQLLKYFVERYPEMSGDVNIKALSKDFQVSVPKLELVFNHFEERGLMRFSYFLNYEISVQLKLEAFELLEKGGFAFEEEVLKKQLLLLESEVDKLKDKLPDATFNRLSTIVNTLISGANLFG